MHKVWKKVTDGIVCHFSFLLLVVIILTNAIAIKKEKNYGKQNCIK